jgi:chromosome segregation ATPase
MSTLAAYKQKLEAEIELAQAKLAELKAHAKNSAADARIKLEGMLDDLERRLDTTKNKLRELGSSGEGAWEQFKGGVDDAWGDFSDGLSKAVAKFRN